MKTRAEATRLLREGLRDAEIARLTGYSRERVRQFRAQLGLPSSPHEGRCADLPARYELKAATPEVEALVLALRADGWSVRRIQSHTRGMAVSARAVRRIAKAYDELHPTGARHRHASDWLLFDWKRCNVCVAATAGASIRSVTVVRSKLRKAGHDVPWSAPGVAPCCKECRKHSRWPAK